MKIENTLQRWLQNILLVGLVGLTIGCGKPETEGKIVKKEIEPERRWIEQRTIAPLRVPPRKVQYLLTDDKDFVLYVLGVDGRTDRFYTSENSFNSYNIGEVVKYNPHLIQKSDIVEEQLIDQRVAKQNR